MSISLNEPKVAWKTYAKKVVVGATRRRKVVFSTDETSWKPREEEQRHEVWNCCNSRHSTGETDRVEQTADSSRLRQKGRAKENRKITFICTTYTDRDERLRIDTDTKTREGNSPFAIDLLRELLDRLLDRKSGWDGNIAGGH